MSDPYFGERWDAPLLDDAIGVRTPVGRRCLHCREAIEAGDRGWIRTVGRLTDGQLVATSEPIHAECDLIGVMGHLVGVCSCTGYDTSSRASAQLVWQRVGQARGLALEDPEGWP